MTWTQNTVACLCGSCSEEIKADAPILLVTSAQLRRCVTCAKRAFNAEPPTNWPAVEVQPAVPSSIHAAAGIRTWAKNQDWFDARMAATGERP